MHDKVKKDIVQYLEKVGIVSTKEVMKKFGHRISLGTSTSGLLWQLADEGRISHISHGKYGPLYDNDMYNKLDNNGGGFFDLPKEAKRCNDSSHDPPSHLHIPHGKGYKHVCPKCGKIQILVPPQITF